MGYLPQPTEEMGEYSVEVRHESFYLFGEDPFVPGGTEPCHRSTCDVVGDHEHWAKGTYEKKRHGIYVYPNPVVDGAQGSIELLIEDIPKIRAALDQVGRVHNGNPNKE